MANSSLHFCFRSQVAEATPLPRKPPSAPPAEDFLKQESAVHANCENNISPLRDEGVFNSEHKMDVSDIQGFEVQDGFELGDGHGRRHSAPDRGQEAKRPVDPPRISSAPPTMMKVSVGESKGGKPTNTQHTTKRQATLTRQCGFQNADTKEPSHTKNIHHAASFDLRAEDGENPEDNDMQDLIDVEDGDIEINCGDENDENFDCSSSRLHMGHGSTSSVHSDPEDADNCSVSGGLSVSSLGNDDEVMNEEGKGPCSGEEPSCKVSKKDEAQRQQV